MHIYSLIKHNYVNIGRNLVPEKKCIACKPAPRITPLPAKGTIDSLSKKVNKKYLLFSLNVLLWDYGGFCGYAKKGSEGLYC